MSLTPNYKIESKDIKLQSIEQYSEIIHDQLDTNYYYFNSPQSQSKDTIVYPPLLKSYAINKDGGEGSITGHREYTVSDESQSITYTAVPKSGWDSSLFKVDWSVTQGSAYFSSTTSNPTVLEIPEKTYGGIGIKCSWTALPASLTIGGGWSNTQFTGQSVDPTGLTFTVTYGDGSTASKIASQLSISPSTWGSTVGTQIATFSYTENGKTVSATRGASVADYWPTVPLTLQAREAGNISITKEGDPGTIYYSKNGGGQTVLDKGVDIPVSAGDKVSFYRTLSGDLSDDNYFTIKCTNNCYVYGNAMSLCNKDNFANLTTIQYEYVFSELFYYNDYIDINESVGRLVLPATTLSYGCYVRMFNGCHSLTTAPALPATTLAEYCYQSMFSGCHNLTTAPVLPATTLAESCYYYMFTSCTSLTTTPVLPATTLAENCYSSMFSGCTSLTTTPVLSATTLAESCYSAMFQGCTSLTTASVLPATTLVRDCYSFMFASCTSLTSITCLATNISAYSCTYYWVNNVSSSGTFYKNSAMSSWTTGNNGIPSGWTVQNA